MLNSFYIFKDNNNNKVINIEELVAENYKYNTIIKVRTIQKTTNIIRFTQNLLLCTGIFSIKISFSILAVFDRCVMCDL